MLKLVQIELCKLRRKRFIWIMLLSAFVMPFFAFLYFGYLGERDVNPALFYKWSAFGGTVFIILPFVLGLFSTMLIHDENRYGTLKQLWIIPVSKMGYFFSKFFAVLIYSICFMMLNGLASIIFSVLPGYTVFDWSSIWFLFERCTEIAVLTAFAVLPVMAVSVLQKGYILPVCAILVYILAGFLITPVNSCVHPLSCTSVVVARDGAISGLTLPQTSAVLGLICICIWSGISILFAYIQLGKRK